MRAEAFTAETQCARADIAVSERMADFTRSAVKKLFEAGNVKINGKSAKPSQSVSVGDKIEVVLPEPVECIAKPEEIGRAHV